nr:PREDICTED: uncharacterized protein LOC105669621 [Linepithema humile]
MVKILLKNNLLNCNCDMYEFLHYNEDKMRNDIKSTQIPLHLTFSQLKVLQSQLTHNLYLNFSYNWLTQMPNLKKLVNKLSVSYNNVSNISLSGLSTTLKVLELHNNKLLRIHPNVLRF